MYIEKIKYFNVLNPQHILIIILQITIINRMVNNYRST